MESIIKSLFGKSDAEYVEHLSVLVAESDKVLSKRETEYLEYLVDTFTQANQMPTEQYFLQKYPEYTNALINAQEYTLIDFKVKVNEVYNDRLKQNASREIMSIATEIQNGGLTDDHVEKIRGLVHTGEKIGLDEYGYDFSSFKDRYAEKKNQPTGLLTFVNAIDEKIGGLSPGTTNIIFAFVSQFKSTWGCNIAYNNTKKLNYNVAMISLEVPKEDMLYNFLCRHSYEPQFNKFPFIPHEKIRKCLLTDEEEDELMNNILPDFNDNGGKLVLLDETDFNTFSFTEIREKLELVDEMCIKETGSGLDAVVWDHAHLFKFSDGMKGLSDGAVINMYVSFIRKLSIKFRKRKGEDEYCKLTNIILAQANRKGFEQANKSQGRYNLMALSEANELERAGYRIMSIWTNENLKESKEATVQLLKNRSGQNLYDPQTVYADGEAYVFGSEVDGFDEMISIDSMDSLFSDGDNMGLF